MNIDEAIDHILSGTSVDSLLEPLLDSYRKAIGIGAGVGGA